MKKRKIFVLLLITVFVLSLFMVGCGNGNGDDDNGDNGEAIDDNGDTGGERPDRLAIATGGTTGVYYPLGGGIANIISENVEGVSANAESTGASVENVNLLSDGDVDFAMVQNDISYYAFNGAEMFDDSDPMENLQGIATLYPETIQIVADANAGINSIEDLVGKRVAVGAPGSGTEANARQILEAYGITYDDFTADYLSFAEAADNLRDGNVDAAFVTAGTPTAAITDLSTQHNVILLSMDQDKIDALISDYPFYTQVVIPGGTYRNQDDDVTAVAVMAMLAVRAELDDDLVYEITEAIFNNLNVLANQHARGGDVSLEGALEGMSLEVHPGAQRFYDEQ